VLPFTSGEHTVIVSAYNSQGETASDPLIVGPVANAGGPYTGQVGAAISVTAAASTDATGTIVNFVWSWGDGASDTSTSADSSHVYANTGVFNITLTVTDDFPASGSATTTATIQDGPPPYSLTASPASVIAGNPITVQWTAPDGSSPLDWIGLYHVGDADTAMLWSQYTNGAIAGTFTLLAPLDPGQYQFRYLLNDGWTDVAQSNPFTVEQGAAGAAVAKLSIRIRKSS
jgi:PKD repeat protein